MEEMLTALKDLVQLQTDSDVFLLKNIVIKPKAAFKGSVVTAATLHLCRSLAFL